MKRLFLFLYLLHSFAFGSAQTHYFIPCDGLFEGGFELLYWRAEAGAFPIAVRDARSPQILSELSGRLPIGASLRVKPHDSFGFRVLVGHVSCDGARDARVQYSGLHQNQECTFLPGEGSFWPQYEPPMAPFALNFFLGDGDEAMGQRRCRIVAREKLSWDALDLEIARRLCLHRRLLGRFFGGLHYVYLDHLLDVTYQGYSPASAPVSFFNISASVQQRRRLFAVGPEAGTELRFALPCGFGLCAKLLLSVIGGETRGRVRLDESVQAVPLVGPATTEESSMNVLYREKFQLMTHYSGRAGVHWTFCAENGFAFFIECGYELQTYLGALLHPIFNASKSTKHSIREPFHLHGLYLLFHLQM